jgi:hypothetical protein
MSQPETISSVEQTFEPSKSRDANTLFNTISLKFSLSIAACFVGCASEPQGTQKPVVQASPTSHPDLKAFSEREEILFLQESELRRIRMNYARVCENETDPEVLASFDLRKEVAENIMKNQYYLHCRFTPDALKQLPEELSVEEVMASLQHQNMDSGEFNTMVSDLIFRFENEQRILRVALHGSITEPGVHQQLVSEYRQQAQQRFAEREAILTVLYKKMLAEAFR